MNKEKALEILLLLSALESWSFSAGQRLPDYLHDNLANTVESLSKCVLEDDA